jgi:hypothetical protein
LPSAESLVNESHGLNLILKMSLQFFAGNGFELLLFYLKCWGSDLLQVHV